VPEVEVEEHTPAPSRATDAATGSDEPPDSLDDEEGSDDQDDDQDDDTSVRPRRAPWHFKVLLVGTVIYLGWRAYQGISWLIHHI
jgi:hypothetical protein